MINDIYDLLKFKLGSEVSDYEFEIIPVPPYDFIQNSLSLEPYEYFGPISNIMGLRTNQILLYFNADVLMKVELIFKGNHLKIITDILETNIKLFPDTIMFLKLYHVIATDKTYLTYQYTILGENINEK